MGMRGLALHALLNGLRGAGRTKPQSANAALDHWRALALTPLPPRCERTGEDAVTIRAMVGEKRSLMDEIFGEFVVGAALRRARVSPAPRLPNAPCAGAKLSWRWIGRGKRWRACTALRAPPLYAGASQVLFGGQMPARAFCACQPGPARYGLAMAPGVAAIGWGKQRGLEHAAARSAHRALCDPTSCHPALCPCRFGRFGRFGRDARWLRQQPADFNRLRAARPSHRGGSRPQQKNPGFEGALCHCAGARHGPQA